MSWPRDDVSVVVSCWSVSVADVRKLGIDGIVDGGVVSVL